MSKIIKDQKKWNSLTKKIFKAQIILDALKEAVKKGQKNINKLRDEKKKLEITKSLKSSQDYCPCGNPKEKEAFTCRKCYEEYGK